MTATTTPGARTSAAGAAAGTPLRQATPPELQSRAQQTSVWLVSGVRPLAALTAGGIAAAFGVWAALLAGTLLYLAPVAFLWASPIRRMATMPEPASAPRRPASLTEGDRHEH
ncbi:hypothetical protein ACWFR1_00365 [Streptomyces sp. NPDC055103]